MDTEDLRQQTIRTFLATSISKGLITVPDLLEAAREVLSTQDLILTVSPAPQETSCEGGVCSPLPAWIQQVRAEREAAERANLIWG